MYQADIARFIEEGLYGLLALSFLLAGLSQLRKGRVQQIETTNQKRHQPWHHQHETLWGFICLTIFLGLLDNILFSELGAMGNNSVDILLLILTTLTLFLLLLTSTQLWRVHRELRKSASI